MKCFDDQWMEMIARGAGQMGVRIEKDQLDAMAFHAAELIKWNKKFNITAITDPVGMAVKHFVDSVALIPWVPQGAAVVDLGSGGGFPGIPLAICRPDIRVVMVDASRKKVSFLNHVVRMENLSHATALHSRVEILAGDDKYAGKFDMAVSRAFTGLGRFVDLALPFLSSQGKIVAMKGDLSTEEVEEVDGSCFDVDIKRYCLPNGDRRALVVGVRSCC
ncbi:16S rRNA (guanine(527)-N(7))-methyltransferase RsmG [Desulfocicer vacuolatum]|nr:16S rRNA (guanine(527)-N(7))-methyltransferase RsmG [Desulfocicer vacuolatum]